MTLSFLSWGQSCVCPMSPDILGNIQKLVMSLSTVPSFHYVICHFAKFCDITWQRANSPPPPIASTLHFFHYFHETSVEGRSIPLAVFLPETLSSINMINQITCNEPQSALALLRPLTAARMITTTARVPCNTNINKARKSTKDTKPTMITKARITTTSSLLNKLRTHRNEANN